MLLHAAAEMKEIRKALNRSGKCLSLRPPTHIHFARSCFAPQVQRMRGGISVLKGRNADDPIRSISFIEGLGMACSGEGKRSSCFFQVD
jgi:hypothetical protein